MSSSTEEEKITEYYNKNILVLEALVKIVNNNPTSKLPVTLNIKGMMVTGNLMSLQEFHKVFGGTILDDLRTDDIDLRDAMRAIVQSFIDVPAIENGKLAFNYVCIQDAKFFLSETKIIENIPAWIGKIECVDGFFLGTMD